jgi:hypothetical protein
MVQVAVTLLATAEGEQDTEVSWAEAPAMRVKLWVPPFRLAVSRADAFETIAATVAVKEPLVCVAAIVTLLGTVTFVMLLDSETVTPPAGAGADNVTVQLELPGAVTVPGEQLRLTGTTITVRLTVADWLWPFSVAVMVAVWLLPTAPLLAVKLALLWPVGTVTLAGTGNAIVLLASETDTALEAA